ncbi:MAG TPA: HAD family hydrolase [Solirubrobacteraceae bacterium]|nr:HAD family hydrolase [Solirubrobacteraceae bacterium]
MSVPSVRALLVDAMGTLVRLLPAAARLRAELAERAGITVSEAEAAQGLAAEIAYYRTHMHEGSDRASVAVLHRDCGAALAAAMPSLAGADPDQVTAALLAALRFAAYPDAAPALRRARERGTRVVVVSNWDASLPAALTDAGLGGLIDGVVSSGQAGAAKPSPEIFARALGIAGVPARAATHVGDSLVQDVAGARAAGIEAVWLNRAGAPIPAGVRAIASLREL